MIIFARWKLLSKILFFFLKICKDLPPRNVIYSTYLLNILISRVEKAGSFLLVLQCIFTMTNT